MDEIEVVFIIDPIFLEIVNNELEVWRNPRRLNGTQVIANNTR